MASRYHPTEPSKDSRTGRSAEGSATTNSSVGIRRSEPRAGLSSEAQASERALEETSDTDDRDLAELLTALNRQIAATGALINKSGMLVKSIDAHWGDSPPQRRPPKFNHMPHSLPENMRGDSAQPPAPPPPNSFSAPPKSPGKR